jgi:hypothetical protein
MCYLFLCVYVRARDCVRVHAYVYVCGCTGDSVCLRACSLTNQACNAPQYCDLASLAPPHFSTLSHERHDFRKKISEHKICVVIFFTNFVLNISHYNKNSARYCHKCENVFM